MGRTSKYTKEVLEAAVTQATSYAGVVRVLGLALSGGSQAHIARRVRHFGIDTSHFTGQAHWRGRPGPNPKRAAADILVVRPPGSLREKASMLRRALVDTGRPYLCERCGLDPDEIPLTLHVDHIDGDWLNNVAENLRFLCPNCHAQTPTYCVPRGAVAQRQRQRL